MVCFDFILCGLKEVYHTLQTEHILSSLKSQRMNIKLCAKARKNMCMGRTLGQWVGIV